MKRKLDDLPRWKDVKKEILSRPGVRKEYETLRPKYEAISAVIKARLEKGLTQKQLAKKAKTKQANISRFEGGRVTPSIPFLQKIAQALGMQLEIRFKPAVPSYWDSIGA